MVSRVKMHVRFSALAVTKQRWVRSTWTGQVAEDIVALLFQGEQRPFRVWANQEQRDSLYAPQIADPIEQQNSEFSTQPPARRASSFQPAALASVNRAPENLSQ